MLTIRFCLQGAWVAALAESLGLLIARRPLADSLGLGLDLAFFLDLALGRALAARGLAGALAALARALAALGRLARALAALDRALALARALAAGALAALARALACGLARVLARALAALDRALALARVLARFGFRLQEMACLKTRFENKLGNNIV